MSRVCAIVDDSMKKSEFHSRAAKNRKEWCPTEFRRVYPHPLLALRFLEKCFNNFQCAGMNRRWNESAIEIDQNNRRFIQCNQFYWFDRSWLRFPVGLVQLVVSYSGRMLEQGSFDAVGSTNALISPLITVVVEFEVTIISGETEVIDIRKWTWIFETQERLALVVLRVDIDVSVWKDWGIGLASNLPQK